MTVVASHLGLSSKDVNLLKSLFNMLRVSSRTKMEIVFIDLDQFGGQAKIPDIMFINEDDREALNIWNSLAEKYPLTVPVFVIPKNSQEKHDQYTLKRPIMLKRIVSTIHDITNMRATSHCQVAERLNVLVVDDSFAVRKYMEHTLPQLVNEGLKIEYATEGTEALNMMAKRLYGLVFLDVIMPGIDGYKVCKMIKMKHRSYVVMLTSRKSPFDKVRGTMSGCNAYITKPPQESKLKNVLNKCLQNSDVYYPKEKAANTK